MVKPEFCSVHNLTMKIMWVMLAVAATYATTSVGFALDIRTTVTKLSTVSDRSVKDIEFLQAKYAAIDSKMDTLITLAKKDRK